MKVDKTVFFPKLCGTDIPHTPDFAIDRPCDPWGTSLIFAFRSPGIIRTRRGVETARAGDCIVHTPGFPQFHAALPGGREGYRNDFIHIPSETAETLMRGADLPFDTLLRTGNPAVLTPFLLELQLEALTKDPFSERMVKNLLERMFLSLARAAENFSAEAGRMTAAEKHYYPVFQEIRENLRRNYTENPGIRVLAGRASLSPERFAALYRKFFHSSPHSDLIGARIEAAKRLLASGLGVKESGALCGWRDAHYFSRIFRKRTGAPPEEFG